MYYQRLHQGHAVGFCIVFPSFFNIFGWNEGLPCICLVTTFHPNNAKTNRVKKTWVCVIFIQTINWQLIIWLIIFLITRYRDFFAKISHSFQRHFDIPSQNVPFAISNRFSRASLMHTFFSLTHWGAMESRCQTF